MDLSGILVSYIIYIQSHIILNSWLQEKGFVLEISPRKIEIGLYS